MLAILVTAEKYYKPLLSFPACGSTFVEFAFGGFFSFTGLRPLLQEEGHLFCAGKQFKKLRIGTPPR